MIVRNCYGVDCSGWELVHSRATYDMLGYVPDLLVAGDERPAREQFNERYEFGGWAAIPFTMLDSGSIKYPGDPALPPIAQRMLGKERVVAFPSALFAIIQPDGSFEVGRLD